MVTESDSREIAEARLQLARYLSDEIAPMIVADAAEILFQAPPEVLAREIHSWVGIQLQGANPSAVSDYLLHSARKIQNLGELELIPKEDLNRYLSGLQPLLVSLCPERDRADLAENLSRLGVGAGEALAARISVSRAPHTGAGGGGGSIPAAGGGSQQPATDHADRVTGGGAHQRAAEQIEPPPQIPPHENYREQKF